MRRDYEIVEEVVEEEIVEEVFHEGYEEEGSGLGGLLIGILALALIGGGAYFAWSKGWIGGKTTTVVSAPPAPSSTPARSGKARPVKPMGAPAKRAPVAPANWSAGIWDGRTPFKCAGHQAFVIKDVQANVAGKMPAITASGDCQLKLEGVSVRSGVALYVAGNARVLVSGGSLEGSEKAIKAWGNAELTLQGVKIEGPVEQKGHAKVSQDP